MKKLSVGARLFLIPLLTAVLLLSGTRAHGQSGKYTLQGKVLDSATNQPVSGVSVSVPGSSRGTVTDENGQFTVESSNPISQLLFSHLSYLEKQVAVSGNGPVTVQLVFSSNSLNNVVVVGYTTQKKVTLTGAVSSISGSDLVTTKNENVINMMAGKIPGVRVIQKSGEPGTFNTNFDIRGMGNPLIIIDGVPRDNITRLDPYEIESISVIKDATAAVYGVRAANGVILVTTKKGKAGKATINYAGSYGWQQYLGFPQLTNAPDFMRLVNEKVGHNPDAPGRVQYADAEIAAYENGTKQSTDWFGATIRKYTPQYQNNISASGGNDKLNYFVSIGDLSQEGMWKTKSLNYKKYNFRSNIAATIANNLTAEMRISGITDQRNAPYTDSWGIIRGLWRQLPIDPLYANNNPDYPYQSADVANPLVVTNTNLSGYKQYLNNWLQGSVSLAYDLPFVKGLQAKVFYSYDYNTADNKEYQKAYNVYRYDPVTDKYSATAANTPTSVSRYYGKTIQKLLRYSLAYKQSFGNHNVNLMGLYEESDRRSDNFNASRQGGLVDALDEIFAGGSLNQVGGMDQNGLTHFTNKGWIGRVDYDFDNRYMLGFYFRYDGSSRFATDGQWGFFPVVTGGWLISE